MYNIKYNCIVPFVGQQKFALIDLHIGSVHTLRNSEDVVQVFTGFGQLHVQNRDWIDFMIIKISYT